MPHSDDTFTSNAHAPLSDDSKVQPDVRIDVDVSDIQSPTLARLIEEVRNEPKATGSYNRAYHRHNR